MRCHDHPGRQRRRLAAAAAGVLVLAACGGDDDATPEPDETTTTSGATTDEDSETSETDDGRADDGSPEPAAEGTDADDTTTSSPPPDESTTTTIDCSPPRAGRAGRIDDVGNDTVRVDCRLVGGGEEISQGSVIATDASGVVDYLVDDHPCSTGQNSSVRIRPSDGLFLAVDNGETACRLGHPGDCAQRTVRGGESLEATGCGTVIVSASSSEASLEIVMGGFVVDDALAQCRNVLGPGQLLTLRADGSTAIGRVQFDTSALLRLEGIGVTVPGPGDELLPGLGEAFDEGRVRLEIEDEPADDSARDILAQLINTEVFTIDDGAVFADEPPGEPSDTVLPIDPIDPIDPSGPALPVDPSNPAFPIGPSSPVLPIDPSSPSIPIDPAVTVPTVPPLAIEDLIGSALLFEAPNGERWEVLYGAADASLLTTGLREAVLDGSFGRFYEAVFDAGLRYESLLPDLLGDAMECG